MTDMRPLRLHITHGQAGLHEQRRQEADLSSASTAATWHEVSFHLHSISSNAANASDRRSSQRTGSTRYYPPTCSYSKKYSAEKGPNENKVTPKPRYRPPSTPSVRAIVVSASHEER